MALSEAKFSELSEHSPANRESLRLVKIKKRTELRKWTKEEIEQLLKSETSAFLTLPRGNYSAVKVYKRPLIIEEGSRFGKGTIFKERVIVKKDCKFAEGTEFSDTAEFGRYCTIGNNTWFQNTANFQQGAKIGNHCVFKSTASFRINTQFGNNCTFRSKASFQAETVFDFNPIFNGPVLVEGLTLKKVLSNLTPILVFQSLRPEQTLRIFNCVEGLYIRHGIMVPIADFLKRTEESLNSCIERNELDGVALLTMYKTFILSAIDVFTQMNELEEARIRAQYDRAPTKTN